MTAEKSIDLLVAGCCAIMAAASITGAR